MNKVNKYFFLEGKIEAIQDQSFLVEGKLFFFDSHSRKSIAFEDVAKHLKQEQDLLLKQLKTTREKLLEL